MTTVMLVDNGSRRADATLALRRLSAALSERLEIPVHAVSLMHSSKVPGEQLDGRPAEILESFLTRQAAQGQRQFLAVPLFFGPSKALSKFIPETVEKVRQSGFQFNVAIAPALCPLPEGEQRLADIMDRAIREQIDAAKEHRDRPPIAVLVDHGSPIPQVTAVRQWLAEQLKARSAGDYHLQEAVMERRPGAEYDFNGPLLASALHDIGTRQPDARVIVAMQFLNPGRHAGSGGDVETICREAQQQTPGMQVAISRLVGEDPQLVDILADRARSGGA